MKRVIITGDDFGMAEAVNEAIERSHQSGVLGTASLMVTGAAAADAVARARRLPTLRVGLHVVLVEGRPALPPGRIPGLVDRRGGFPTRLVRAGFRFFFLPGMRRQIEDEVRAQFEAFARTGLALDHVNAHNHMHLHPTVLGAILKAGREFGMRAVRLPCEPAVPSWRASGRSLTRRLVMRSFLAPWLGLMRSRLRRCGIATNDYVFGMTDSGAMTGSLVTGILRRLPEGVTEIYFHPAVRKCREIDRTMPAYRHVEEFQTLMSPETARALADSGAERIAFGDIEAPARRKRK